MRTKILASFALAFALGDCLSPTEITIVVTTDIACSSLSSTLVVVGPASELETRAASGSTTTCDANGNIGSLVIIPNASRDDSVAFSVITAVGTNSEDCRMKGYANCVVARRSLSFIPHTPLTLPVKLSMACIGQTCTTVDGKLGTCDNGSCVPATVDPTGCETAQGCALDASAPDAFSDASPTTGTIDRLVAGGDGTCVRRIETGGTHWYCWGGNNYNALTSLPTITSKPTYVSAFDGFDRIAIGFTHGCGFQTGGAMECWGSNEEGQLGDSTTNPHAMPKPVSGTFGAWTDVTVGDTHSCGATATNVYCWGDNSAGESGVATDAGTTIDAPNLAGGSKTFTAPWSSLAAGAEFSCVIGHQQSIATIGCWGINTNDELGLSSSSISSSASALLIGAPTNILAASAETVCSADSKTVMCWGANTSDVAGVTATGNVTPTAVAGISGATALARGSTHTCAIVASGTFMGRVVCWGDNQAGELGTGGVGVASAMPAAVVGLTGTPTLLAAGASHTCVVLDGTTVACWGSDASSQLGDGMTMTSRSTPITLSF